MKLSIFILVALSSNALLAAGKGGGHISDLFYPAINVTILAVFFVWKVLPMIKNGFNNNHNAVSEAFNLAEVKEAEAQMELESVKKKLDAVTSEAANILEEAKKEASVFETAYTKETEERIKTSSD